MMMLIVGWGVEEKRERGRRGEEGERPRP